MCVCFFKYLILLNTVIIIIQADPVFPIWGLCDAVVGRVRIYYYYFLHLFVIYLLIIPVSCFTVRLPF